MSVAGMLRWFSAGVAKLTQSQVSRIPRQRPVVSGKTTAPFMLLHAYHNAKDSYTKLD